jgi:uncharacterized protein (TIGR03435 family)
MRAIAAVAVLTLGAGCAMAQATHPPDQGATFAAYDVVSVKPSNTDGQRVFGVRPLADGIDAPAVTVGLLVQQAYGSPLMPQIPVPVTGLPNWAESDHYSVQAKMSADQAEAFAKLNVSEQKQRRQSMLQAILADYFKLKVHRVDRQVPVYELLVAKAGLKMKESDTTPDGRKLSDGRPVPFSMSIQNGEVKIIAQGNAMDYFGGFMGPAAGLDHPVVNKTGLTGKYSFTLTFAAEGGPVGASAPDPAPSVFEALEVQLGLRLQRSVANVQGVVVDHVERPAAD